MSTKGVATGVLIGLMLVLVAVVGPLLTIWALNTLFGLGIAYTFKTWLATMILGFVIGGITSNTNRK